MDTCLRLLEVLEVATILLLVLLLMLAMLFIPELMLIEFLLPELAAEG